MSWSSATVVGGAAGAFALAAIIIGVVWFCKLHCKKSSNKNSETGSSEPSALGEWNRGGGSGSAAAQPSLGQPGERQFTMEELEQATKNFNESNLIGCGSFGLVYKGLLSDGTVVAIKRRPGAPRQEFVLEVANLSEIRHRNLVALLGYSQESRTQILVFEYLPNGSICNHLYDSGQDSTAKLEFKQRLSIALGVAKGLCHLHSLKPPLIHKNFKTANVLVDENFIAKVADAGISKLLEKIDDAGPSHTTNINIFRDPEVEESGSMSEISDVYSYGVFLLELITGRETSNIDFFRYEGNLIHWVEKRLNSNKLVDCRLFGSFTLQGMKDLINLTLQCMSVPGKGRPKMEIVVFELERIHEKEMALTTGMGEDTTIFTLGSQLFTLK
ncbi:probable serine/threonine-protein kinase PBL15 [Malania oleifera]|uniref:probable serine/threonine-protein kinase PBL15 n=1 Tax=Malania oleifera TaxID=397392 RepID=UPI0025AD9F54|nr:probable serine/threonine-protein kinase PBL15 [Malania oleifera]